MNLFVIMLNGKDGSQAISLAVTVRAAARKTCEIIEEITGSSVGTDLLTRNGRVKLGSYEMEVLNSLIRLADDTGEKSMEIAVTRMDLDMPFFALTSYGRVYVILRTDGREAEQVSWKNSIAQAFKDMREAVEKYETALEKAGTRYRETRYRNTSTIMHETNETVRYHVVELLEDDMRAA